MNLTIRENYPPIVYPVGNQTATENQLFTVSVDGYDSLGNYPLEFSTNFSSMALPLSTNSTSANFSFTPGISDRGNHSVLVTAYNSKGASNSTVFWLEVIEVNNPPVLDYIGPRIAKINKTFVLNVNATDPDGNNLNFSNNHTEIFEIDPLTGLINFTPNESIQGVYSINISVTDDGNPSLTDYEIVEFTITPNRNPLIDPITNQTATENQVFELQINSTDPDGDPIQFFDNSTIFNINLNTGLINFTPNKNHVGVYYIEINVTDNDGGINSTVFLLNITEVNNPPYFDPLLENQTATEGILFYYDINATDLENDTLTFSNNNTDLFEIDSNTGVISFTPTNDDVGNHSINISVTDNSSITSSVITISILNVNTPPYIVSYIPLNLTPNAAENSSLQFNVTADDEDIIHGDVINYTWYVDSVIQSFNHSWVYEPDFASAGFRNVTVVVSDIEEETVRIEWNVSVNNTNRLPTFGLVVHTTESDFNESTKNNVDTETQSGSILLSKQNLSDYYSSGTFTSSIIDLSADSNMNITYINWTETRPAGTNVTMQTRSSATQAALSSKEWSSVYIDDSIIDIPHYRYIQYRANLSTSDTLVTPEVHDVKISYIISEFTGNQNTIYVDWIDLDNFFNDNDNDDNITYDVFGNFNIDVDIGEETNKVILTPAADWIGSETIYFTMNDSYNTTRSNDINITFIEYQGIDTGNTVIYSSGGSSRTIIRTIEEEVEKPYSFNIITPQTITMYKNDTAIAPINLNNKGEDPLKDVQLSATASNENIKLSFTKDYFKEITKNSYVTTNLIIESYDTVGSYEIVVYANVREPEFNDSAKFMVSSIELGQWSPEEFETKISFTRDILESNPECLELNEQLTQARELIARGEYKRGQLILQSVVDACRYLITAKEPFVEEPSSEMEEESKRIRIIALTAGLLFVILLISYIFLRGNSRKRKKK
ncbi:MAG: Ig-like domain-containing protein [Candidatus Nanoarchaeia archaeon]|nr:Ig-like domain-containing protein [Candidatus Nanoarchaeia archaeon]